MPRSGEPPNWHEQVRAAVRECLQTWQLQARKGRVTPKARNAILARATVLILTRLDGHPADMVMALLPGLVRTMLAAFVDLTVPEGPK